MITRMFYPDSPGLVRPARLTEGQCERQLEVESEQPAQGKECYPGLLCRGTGAGCGGLPHARLQSDRGES